MEARPSPGLLMDISSLLENCVSAEDLMVDLTAEQDLLLMLPDGGNIARPQLQLVLLQDNCSLWVIVVAPDQLQLHVLHSLDRKPCINRIGA